MGQRHVSHCLCRKAVSPFLPFPLQAAQRVARDGKTLHCSLQSWCQVREPTYRKRPTRLLVSAVPKIGQLRLDRQHNEGSQQPKRKLLPRSPQRRRHPLGFRIRHSPAERTRNRQSFIR